MPPPHLGPPYSIRRALRTLLEEGAPATRPHPHSHSHSRRPLTPAQRRAFHDYFVTHLPSSSMSPDKQGPSSHRLPRAESQPHSGSSSRAAQLGQPSSASSASASAASAHGSASASGANRDTTIVRIPIKSAKHHFGAGVSRGSRPYNEDTYQAGTIEIPAFAQRQPKSLSRRPGSGQSDGGAPSAASETGDPQVFYFGVFDGHGGSECSEFLAERLHGYIEEAALLFGMESSLRRDHSADGPVDSEGGVMGEQDAEDLQKSLVSNWKETVGGYFKRFRPEYFPALSNHAPASSADPPETRTLSHSSIETVLTYAFLKADLDFTAAQASKHSEASTPTRPASSLDDPVLSDKPLNDNDLLYHPDRPASQNLRTARDGRPSSSPDLNAPIGGATRFQGGSTASVAMISTPSPAPFWNPASPSTLLTAHVGDTRILLCRTRDGAPVPQTTNHHPDAPVEATRLRRYASAFITDSFGEQRLSGLANTRAFGDVSSKRLGVSAEPQLTLTPLAPAEYAFLVLTSDGVSGVLSDQEIVDIVKEARTPAQAAQELVGFAVEVAEGGGADNATAVVVRLGGWERRSEGGAGSLGTKELREFRRREAEDPRARRR